MGSTEPAPVVECTLAGALRAPEGNGVKEMLMGLGWWNAARGCRSPGASCAHTDAALAEIHGE